MFHFLDNLFTYLSFKLCPKIKRFRFVHGDRVYVFSANRAFGLFPNQNAFSARKKREQEKKKQRARKKGTVMTLSDI